MAWKRIPTHRCLAPDCQREIPHVHLMCPEHWKLIPRATQTVIVEQWRYGLTNRCHPTAPYIDAMRAAQKLIRAHGEERMARANELNHALDLSWRA